MTTYANDLNAWLRSKRAECAERAESPGTPRRLPPEGHSAHCAHSARLDRVSASEVPEGFGVWPLDAQYQFHERMGIAAELGMDLHPGAYAWMIAEEEARATMPASIPSPAAEPIGGFGTPAGMATSVSALLDVPVYAHIRPPNSKFPGEPDWDVVIPPSATTSRSSECPPSLIAHARP